jgi:hypothetical protein
MNRTLLTLVVTIAVLGAGPGPGAENPLDYEVVAVKRHLLLAGEKGELELQAGDQVRSGASLRTGSRSSADLEVIEHAARFHIGTRTRFRLAHGSPGVLIDVERGSLRAVFGKLGEGDDRERLVTTPSAVLAVRGTEYGVEVEKDGDTSVVVFDGTVEVRDQSGTGGVVRVEAGQSTRIRKGRSPDAPVPHVVTPDDWDRGRRAGSSNWGGGQQTPTMGNQPQQSGPGSQSPSSQSGSRRHGG